MEISKSDIELIEEIVNSSKIFIPLKLELSSLLFKMREDFNETERLKARHINKDMDIEQSDIDVLMRMRDYFKVTFNRGSDEHKMYLDSNLLTNKIRASFDKSEIISKAKKLQAKQFADDVNKPKPEIKPPLREITILSDSSLFEWDKNKTLFDISLIPTISMKTINWKHASNFDVILFRNATLKQLKKILKKNLPVKELVICLQNKR